MREQEEIVVGGHRRPFVIYIVSSSVETKTHTPHAPSSTIYFIVIKETNQKTEFCVLVQPTQKHMWHLSAIECPTEAGLYFSERVFIEREKGVMQTDEVF